jgi:hypothetical protein
VTSTPADDDDPDVTDLPDTGGGPLDRTQSGFVWTLLALVGAGLMFVIRLAWSRRPSRP